MFHLKYASKRGFLSWGELGCLSRSMGFQIQLFPSNITDEIAYDDRGLQIQEIYRMLDYKLLHKALHLTCNIHNDNWNVAVFRKSVKLVDHRAFTFKQLHCIRVAYQLYEQQDSRGMFLHQRVMLRALQMCGRTIAPLKLMHRIKHMKEDFAEPGRIQLDEFLDLTLWCDEYVHFKPEEMEDSEGMENKLFKLVNFNRLMSHHDGRLADRLNAEYLSEEWDFGVETLGSKKVPKEPPVNNQIRLQQVENQKNYYRPLKSEVDKSEDRLHRSRVGFIRPRPLTAPDLYRFAMGTPDTKTTSDETIALTVHDVIEKVFKKSPAPVVISQTEPFRPTKYERKPIATVVKPEDVEETGNKMDAMLFEMETMESRYEYEMAKDRKFLLPNYKPRPKTAKAFVSLPEENVIKPRKRHHISLETRINNLVHPRPQLKSHHTKSCDARHRGWYSVNSSDGHHYIVASQTHQRSPQADLHQRLHEKNLGEIRYLHRENLHRHSPTARSTSPRRKRRPFTAPSLSDSRTTLSSPESTMVSGRGIESEEEFIPFDERSSSVLSHTDEDDSGTCDADKLATLTEKISRSPHDKKPDADVEMNSDEPEVPNNQDEHESERISPETILLKTAVQPDDTCKRSPPSRSASTSEESDDIAEERPIQLCSAKVSFTNPGPIIYEDKPDADFNPDAHIPVPTMTHSKPSVVEVGQIGKISLLENIAEDKHLESFVEETEKKRASRESTASTNQRSVNNPTDDENNAYREVDVDEDAEELRKLQAIAMLRIYTHRLNSNKKRRSKHIRFGEANESDKRGNLNKITTIGRTSSRSNSGLINSSPYRKEQVSV